MGGGKSSTSTQSVSIPPEVLARYNAVNARAENVAKQPFQQYGGQFVAPLTETQQAGVAATSAASQSAQPYFGAATGLTMSGARDVGPLTQDQISYYQNPAMLATLAPTQAALQQQQGQQLAQQQAEAIKAGAFGGSGANMQRQILRGQQQLGMGQALAPIYQRAYETGLQTAQGQQGVVASDLARRMQAGQQIAGLGTGAQAAALQGAQAQIGAGTLGQQTQQADLTARYQQFLQERGYDFQVAQFLANIAMGTGALSGSTTTTTQPRGFFSNRGGFKTGETVRKAYGGGIDPNSMGGAVYEPGAFERGGYATDGRVDPTDISSILAQMRSFQTPMGGAGPYGQAAGAAPHGPSGIVPQQQLHTPKLMTAGALPKQQPGTGAELGKMYSLADEATKGLSGKGLTQRAGEKAFGTNAVAPTYDAKGNVVTEGQAAKPGFLSDLFGSKNPDVPIEKAGIALDLVPAMASGGGIMPRDHFGLGGSTVNPYENRDPSESYIEDTLQEEEEAKKPEMLKPSGGGGGGGGGGFGDVVKVASKIIPFFLKDGGVVPRQHFYEGGEAEQPVRQYFDYLTKEKGYEPHVAAGILGNAYHESAGLQPKIVGDQGKSIGLFQFHERGEQPAFRQWATENQRDISDPYAQLDFVHNRLQGPYAKTLEQMRSAADPASSTEFFMRGYERPKEATAALDRRQAYANAIASGEKLPTFRAYTGGEGGFGAASSQQAIQRATSGEREGLGAGKPTSFIDGIGLNKQTILPLLQGIGAMASSKSISPWAAALQGLGAGAKAYGDVEAQQAEIEKTKTGTGLTREQISAAQQTQTQKDVFLLPNGQQVVLMPDGNTITYGEWVKRGRPPTYSQSRAYGAQKPAGGQPSMGGGVSVSPESAPYSEKIGANATNLANDNATFVQNNGVKSLALDPKTNNPFSDAADRSNIAATGMPQTLTFAKALSSTTAGGPITSSVIDPFLMKLVDLGSRAGLDLRDLKAEMSAAEVVQKLNTQLANATRKGAAYEELQRISQSIPSTWNSKEGQADLVASMLSNERTSLDEHNYYNNYRRYLESQHGLTADESLYSGRGLKEQFLKDTALKREQEKKAMAGMFNDYILDKTGKPALVSKDAQGNPRPTTVLNYLIENAGSGDPRIMKALAAKYGDQVIKNMPRYFGGQ